MIFTAYYRAITLCLAATFCCQSVQAQQVQAANSNPPLKLSEELQFVPASVANLPPAAASAVSASSADNAGREVLGEGDQLNVSVFGQPDLSAELTIGETGIITLPLVGTVDVRGKSANEIAALFASKLEQGQYLINPKVTVRISQQQSRGFSVLGEVVKPGRFPIQGPLSVFDALSLAGGVTPRAGKTLKILRRSGAAGVNEFASLSIDYDNPRTTAQFMQLIQPNDVLIVAPQKNFYVYGEVRKPGVYPIEDELNVMRVLSIAGGISERGSDRRIVIHRKDQQGTLKVLPANLNDIIEPGDVVFINERIF